MHHGQARLQYYNPRFVAFVCYVRKSLTGERKISIDGAIKEAIRLEVESAVNQIMGHEFTAFLGYEKTSKALP